MNTDTRVDPTYTNHSRIPQLSRVCSLLQNAINKITKTVIYYLSPKQAMRPESLSEMCINIIPKISYVLLLQCWKIRSLFTASIPIHESASYVEALSVLEKIAKKNDTVLSIEEKNTLTLVFERILKYDKYLDKFDFFILSKPKNLREIHNNCKKLLLMKDDAFFDGYYSKIKYFSKLDIEDEIGFIEENEKLNIRNICILNSASTMKSYAELLHQNEINGIEILLSRWSKIEKIGTSHFFSELKKLCLESHPAGTVFLADRNTVEIATGEQPTLIGIFRQIFMGRIRHIGIFVQPEEKGLHLSHMFGMAGHHAVGPVCFPLNLPFSYSLEFDISPLIPKEVSEEHRQILSQSFSTAFQKFAEEPHPELLLAETKAHINMLIFGHKKIRSEPLKKVRLPSKDTPIMCSSYVGIIFLQAICEVNAILKKLNYQEEIPHPFGEHENLMNLDILRLIYLWNRLKIIQEPHAHPIINKFMSISYLNLNSSS